MMKETNILVELSGPRPESQASDTPEIFYLLLSIGPLNWTSQLDCSDPARSERWAIARGIIKPGVGLGGVLAD